MASMVIPPEQILSLLQEGPARIAVAAARVAPERLRARPAPEEWSANEVLAHLRACADVWGESIRRIITEDHPTIRAVNPRTWMEKTDYPELEFQPSLEAFTAQRAELLAFLEEQAEASWQRTATVKGAGRPLEQTMHFFGDKLARHERTHVKQIERLVKAL
jgi:hypothetical protein